MTSIYINMLTSLHSMSIPFKALGFICVFIHIRSLPCAIDHWFSHVPVSGQCI